MPLIIPKTLPAYDALYEENVFVMHRERALAQHIRPLEILILNLMPTKIATETQIARLLANTPLQVHMTLLQTASHAATHVSAAHLDAFYKTFDEVKNMFLRTGNIKFQIPSAFQLLDSGIQRLYLFVQVVKFLILLLRKRPFFCLGRGCQVLHLLDQVCPLFRK